MVFREKEKKLVKDLDVWSEASFEEGRERLSFGFGELRKNHVLGF